MEVRADADQHKGLQGLWLTTFRLAATRNDPAFASFLQKPHGFLRTEIIFIHQTTDATKYQLRSLSGAVLGGALLKP